MTNDTQIDVKLSTSLIITPQMRHSIELLAMSRADLELALSKEIQENPLLEEEQEEPLDFSEGETEETIFSQSLTSDQSVFGTNILKQRLTLPEYLADQVRISKLNTLEKEISIRLLGEINDNGFLDWEIFSSKDAFMQEISRDMGLPVTWLESVRKRLAMLDPVGCVSFDVRECLLFQLRHQNFSETSLPYRLVSKYFELLRKRSISQLSSLLRKEKKQVAAAMQIISLLEPRPGRKFKDSAFSPKNHHLLPDVSLTFHESGFFVLYNDNGLPKLKINRSTLLRLKLASKPDAKNYLSKKMRAAIFFLRAIYQRQRTICRVARQVVERQKQWFFDGGPLIPLTLKEIASDLGLHESTVCRVSKEKYIETPRGIYEISSFFVSSLDKLNGSEISGHEAKNVIKKLILGEDKTSPLSDDAIAVILSQKGITIARRTVAKYREKLGILRSNKRRDFM